MNGGVSQSPKNVKQCMKLNWNFQRGGVIHRANPFHGGGGVMGIFWNYTLYTFAIIILLLFPSVTPQEGSHINWERKFHDF